MRNLSSYLIFPICKFLHNRSESLESSLLSISRHSLVKYVLRHALHLEYFIAFESHTSKSLLSFLVSCFSAMRNVLMQSIDQLITSA